MGVAESLRKAAGYLGARTDEGYDDDEIYDEESPRRPQRTWEQGVIPFAGARPTHSEFCLVVAHDFDDAKQIADRLKADTPVIVNMQGAEPELTKRLIDFCSGLTYALEGSLQRIDERILLLAPRNADLSGAPPAGHLKNGFFNQV